MASLPRILLLFLQSHFMSIYIQRHTIIARAGIESCHVSRVARLQLICRPLYIDAGTERLLTKALGGPVISVKHLQEEAKFCTIASWSSVSVKVSRFFLNFRFSEHTYWFELRPFPYPGAHIRPCETTLTPPFSVCVYPNLLLWTLISL